MELVRQSHRKLLICLAIAIPIALLILAWMTTRESENTTESVRTITNIAGEDIEVTDNFFDGIGKDEWISVYASPTKEGKQSLLNKLHRQRTEIFRYDPGAPGADTLSITASGSNKILISIPSVSSVFLKKTNVENIAIDYEIGHVDYP